MNMYRAEFYTDDEAGIPRKRVIDTKKDNVPDAYKVAVDNGYIPRGYYIQFTWV